jgi:hypothetical protein
VSYPQPQPQPPHVPYAPPPHVPYAPPPPPGSGGSEPAPKPQGTNGFAVAALVLGIFGAILLSVIFAVVALVQVARSGQRGKGLAIAGLAISGAWLVVLGTVIAVAVMTADDSSGRVMTTSLVAGDCINDLKEGDRVLRLPKVACTEPHDGEVFAVIPIAGDRWPGESEVFAQAEKACNDRLPAYSRVAVEDPGIQLFLLHPTASSWAGGDRSAICILTDPSGKRTGSLRD